MNISQERPIGSLFLPTNSKPIVKYGFGLKAILAAVGVLCCQIALASPIYWSLFNIESESAITADYVTYASLDDMFNDTNRTGVFSPSGFNAGRNIVGSGAFVFRGPISVVVAPGTIALLGLGLAGLAVGRMRRVMG